MCDVLSSTGPAKTPKPLHTRMPRDDKVPRAESACSAVRHRLGLDHQRRVRQAYCTLAQLRWRPLTQSTCQNKTVAKALTKRREVLLDEADSGRASMYLLGCTQGADRESSIQADRFRLSIRIVRGKDMGWPIGTPTLKARPFGGWQAGAHIASARMLH